jgi:hypothetical protein
MPHSKTTVTAGKGYKNTKTTEKYTPDTAPINYQENQTPNQGPPSANRENVPHITLEPDKPEKDFHVAPGFLESFSRVYISGQYPQRGHVNLKVKAIIGLLVRNNGLYHIIVSPAIQKLLLNALEYGDESILGEQVSRFTRDRVVAMYKHDNAIP